MILIVITGRRDARLVGEEVWTVCRSSIRGDWHDYICSLFCCFCSFWSTWLYLQSFCLFCCFWQLLKRWSTINQVDTEQDRVILIRTVVQFMATKVGPQFMVFFYRTLWQRLLFPLDAGTHKAEPKEALSIRWLLCERAAEGIQE